MVAVARPLARTRGWHPGWTAALAGVLVLGAALRLAGIGGSGVGNRSAVVMAVLLTLGACAAAWLLGGARTALVTTIAMTALFDFAALPDHNPADYDGVQALYRTDQSITVRNTVESGITLLVQPVFQGARPRFDLTADVNGVTVRWSCPFTHGIQRFALPIPAGEAPPEVKLRLDGAPSREGDYLLVYTSSFVGGPVIYFGADATTCTPE